MGWNLCRYKFGQGNLHVCRTLDLGKPFYRSMLCFQLFSVLLVLWIPTVQFGLSPSLQQCWDSCWAPCPHHPIWKGESCLGTCPHGVSFTTVLAVKRASPNATDHLAHFWAGKMLTEVWIKSSGMPLPESTRSNSRYNTGLSVLCCAETAYNEILVI